MLKHNEMIRRSKPPIIGVLTNHRDFIIFSKINILSINPQKVVDDKNHNQ